MNLRLSLLTVSLMLVSILLISGCNQTPEPQTTKAAQVEESNTETAASTAAKIETGSKKKQMAELTDKQIKAARTLHDQIITLDTHNDFSNANFVEEKNYTMRLKSQVNLPKMVEGGLDVSWLIVYTGQGELTK
jgi:K+-sensing histidine kinase KdpD